MNSLKFAERFPALTSIVTWLMRFLVGGLFIFSGFTKGVDVWGTIFKFNEYFNAWGYEVWDGLILVGVFLLCLIEFITGVFILLGCFRRAAPIVAILIMAFMLPLTLWLAIANPVSDCGCFGDALKLTNWETFYKNIVITAGTIWLLIFNRRAYALITPYLQWIAFVASGVYLLAIAWLGYYYQPLLDFRPYKTGTYLIDSDGSSEDANDADYDEDDLLRFVYEKDGETKEFTINDDLPDEEDGWTFVERYYADSENGAAFIEQPSHVHSTEKNLRLFTEDGIEDVTEEVIGAGRQLILMIPNISEVSASVTWKINSLYDWCSENDIDMIATVGGNPLEIREWKDISLAEYPIYTSDDTSIEEVVRGNPGIVYVEDGIIKWKSSLKSIDIDDFQEKGISSDPMYFARDNVRILRNLTWIYLIIMAALMFFSCFPAIVYRIFRKRIPQGIPHKKRMPAEWESPQRILLCLPSSSTDWDYILDEALAQYERLVDTLIEGGENVILIHKDDAAAHLLRKWEEKGVTLISDIEYNDTWTRDYGVLTIETSKALEEMDFGFNGWGLKFASDHDNLVNLKLAEKGVLKPSRYHNNRDFVLEGGSIESDGEGTILTTSRCLCSPNRNGGKTKVEIEEILRKRLGARRILWLDYGFLEGDDTDSHIDTLARIAPDSTIIYVAPPENEDDIHYKELREMEKQIQNLRTQEGKPYKLIPLPFPDAIYDNEGNRLPATYANYLVTKNNIYVPVYNQPEKDLRAVEQIRLAFPDHKIYTVDCTVLIRQHGSLHCSTMQLY